MKTATGRFLERLIASMPIQSIRKTTTKKGKTSGHASGHPWGTNEETLHRIFMARYRVQHL